MENIAGQVSAGLKLLLPHIVRHNAIHICSVGTFGL